MHRTSVQAMYFSLIKCHLEHGVDLELGCCAVRIHPSLYARIHVNDNVPIPSISAIIMQMYSSNT